MTGRRFIYGDHDGVPYGYRADITDVDKDGFEDSLIARMDWELTVGKAIKALPPSQQRVLVRYMLGYKAESPAERMSLSRARRTVAKVLETAL